MAYFKNPMEMYNNIIKIKGCLCRKDLKKMDQFTIKFLEDYRDNKNLDMHDNLSEKLFKNFCPICKKKVSYLTDIAEL